MVVLSGLRRRVGRIAAGAVDPGGVISSAIEAQRVVGSIIYFATEISEPGVIQHTEGNRITLGEPDGTRSDRIRAIAEALIASGFRCPITTRIRHEICVKVLGNASFNPVSALTGATLVQIARDPGTSSGDSQHHAGSRSGFAQAWEWSCRFPSISALRARKKLASTRLRCCRIWKPAGRWNWKHWWARWWNWASEWASHDLHPHGVQLHEAAVAMRCPTIRLKVRTAESQRIPA